jgi:acetate CoA/acetoacetate CoA-transferase alpha subunit
VEKIGSIKDAVEKIKDGMTVMVGGFLGVGTPEALVDALVAKGVKNLTVICNDSAFPDRGIGKLIVNKQIKKLITSHIGTNPETGRQMNEGETEVELVPQGTLAERIRAAGAGLGGILTPTGVGTIVEQGKKKLEINGKEYLLELPIKADIALLKAKKADKKGNLVYRKSARNFNPIMATAADFVIVQVDEIVDVGEIDPDDVMTPGIFVDMIVRGDN